MTQVRWSDDEAGLQEDSVAPSSNEQLLRYIGMRDSSVADIDRGYLVRAEMLHVGTDFP